MKDNKIFNLEQMKEDLKRLKGFAPYNTGSNICWNDAYFAVSLKHKYGMSIEEMEKLTGISGYNEYQIY